MFQEIQHNFDTTWIDIKFFINHKEIFSPEVSKGTEALIHCKELKGVPTWWVVY